MNANAILNLDRTNAALVEHDPHFIGVERALDRSLKRVLVFLLVKIISLLKL
jgi:hypothetical protein